MPRTVQTADLEAAKNIRRKGRQNLSELCPPMSGRN
ncbi:hypothetical protein CGLO_05486 [Colletotrichum gloeosporioides Cg-14]|uniref:Uncharacterized protein n=1 Tax=Colletotrichum gloeosporioides (strain Cg-14) TaxID=1237896 RepID=T0KRE6_COLGC|nr:hypothetical protein CGLO_05486 [Colletotrichum gloeosporioides Cg-14]